MGIASVVPVNMSGSIMLNTNDFSTWLPVVASAASVLITWMIIWKSTKDMKEVIKQNRENELLKLAEEERIAWEDRLRTSVADFSASIACYDSVTIGYVDSLLSTYILKFNAATKRDFQIRYSEAVKLIERNKSLVFNLLVDKGVGHEALINAIHAEVERAGRQQADVYKSFKVLRGDASQAFGYAQREKANGKRFFEILGTWLGEEKAKRREVYDVFEELSVGVPNSFHELVDEAIKVGKKPPLIDNPPNP